MFEEPGEKLKKLAVILFWGIMIVSVILAFTLGIEGVHYTSSVSGLVYTTTVFHDVLFFSLLLGGPLGAYILGLVLSGFGELVENSEKVAEDLRVRSR